MPASALKKSLAAAAVAALLATPLLAHESGSGWWQGWRGDHMMDRGQMMDRGHMMGGWGMRGRMMDSGSQDWMLKRIDGRLAFIKAELKITDAQSAAWDDVATTVRNTTETHNAMMRSMMEDRMSGTFSKKPLPERLTIRQTHIEARLEQVKSLQEAFSKLYDVLNDDQKKVADDIALPMMGMGMGMGRGMGRHMMMH